MDAATYPAEPAGVATYRGTTRHGVVALAALAFAALAGIVPLVAGPPGVASPGVGPRSVAPPLIAPLLAPPVSPAGSVAARSLAAPDAVPLAVPHPDALAAKPALLEPGTRIRIPRLGIDLPLADGDLARDVIAGATPDGVALLYPGTAVPGAGAGNSYVYAHARVGAFLALWQAATGDMVIVTSGARELRYIVERVVPRVAPNDVSWLAQDGSERLTLQTSTGPGGADPRFVVVARPDR